MKLSFEQQERFKAIETEAIDFIKTQLAKNQQVAVGVFLIKDRVRLHAYFQELGYDAYLHEGKGVGSLEDSRLSFVGSRTLSYGFRTDKSISMVATRPEPYSVAIQMAASVGPHVPCFIPYRQGPKLFYLRQGLDLDDADLMKNIRSGQYIGDYP